MKRSNIQTVTIHSDKIQLHGSLHLPKTDNPPVVIGLHGLFSDSESPKQIDLAERCANHGIAYLRLDHRGCGQSQGNFFTQTTFTNRCHDLMTTAMWLRNQPELGTRLGLFGSSMGGAVALSMASQLKATAIATVAAPIRWFPADDTIAQAAGAGQMPDDFWDQQIQFDIRSRLAETQNAILFHGTDDEVVPISHGQEIYATVQEPKEWVPLKGGDHRISQKEHQSQLMETALNWFCSHLLQTQ